MRDETQIVQDETTFVQVLHKVFNQISLKARIKAFGDQAIEGMTKELCQLHLQESSVPKMKAELTPKQWQSRCEAVNLIKDPAEIVSIGLKTFSFEKRTRII